MRQGAKVAMRPDQTETNRTKLAKTNDNGHSEIVTEWLDIPELATILGAHCIVRTIASKVFDEC